MKNFIATAMIIDRPTATKALQEIRGLPGAWGEMVDVWYRLAMFPYVVMLAHTKGRVRRGAPLVMMAADETKLREVIRYACSQMDGIQCRWCLFVEAGSAAHSVSSEEVLADTVPGGRA